MWRISIIAVALFTGACAQKPFPSKNITLVVPYSPGGASDTAARIFGQLFEKEIGVPVIVENRTGGAGAVGLSYVQKSTPDGYTMAYMPVESIMLESLGHVEMKPSDFAFIGGATVVPAALTVSVDSPWKTYDEFITYAKANAGKVRVGNSGPGSIWHLAAAALGKKEGVEFTHVPFDGGATAVAGLLGGHIEAVTVSENEVRAGVIDKKLRILTSMGTSRGALSQDIPTMQEMGKDFIMLGWGAFAVPAKTPPSTLAKLTSAAEKVLQGEEFKKQVADRGLVPGYRSAADIQKFAQEQYEFFAELIKEMGLAQKK